MTVPVWPATLPQSLNIDGYEESLADLRLRTSMDVGPAKMRRRSSSGPQPIKGSMILSSDQVDTLVDFYRSDLVEGTLRFSWVDPRHPATAVEFRFVEPPSFPSNGATYKASLSLEILP